MAQEDTHVRLEQPMSSPPASIPCRIQKMETSQRPSRISLVFSLPRHLRTETFRLVTKSAYRGLVVDAWVFDGKIGCVTERVYRARLVVELL